MNAFDETGALLLGHPAENRDDQRARSQAAKLDDEVARLEAAARTAEARVENVTDSLARVGFSEPLAAKQRAEEAKLLDARTALAAATTPAPLPRAYSGRTVPAVLENIGAAARAKPQKAKALLHGVVDAILMQPMPEGYAVRVTLKKTGPAILSDGGAGDFQTGCGGPMLPPEQTLAVALSSVISPVRGVSHPERLLKVHEPTLVVVAAGA